MRLREHEYHARRRLSEAGVDSPGLCARILVERVAGLERTEYILAAERELEQSRAVELAALVARRARGEPLAYILGDKEFFGLSFQVTPATLIPRPETELLVEQALRACRAEKLLFADLGCGSGCIGETLQYLRRGWQGMLVDLNASALEVARANARALGINPDFIQADLFALPFGERIFDLVVSNPPYIGPGEADEVMDEVLAYEPHCALFSGDDGFAHLRAVIEGAASCLKDGAILILEHGYRQAGQVRRYLEAASFGEIVMGSDLSGCPRYAVAKKMQE